MTDTQTARILDVDPTAYHKLPGLSPSLAHVLYTTCGLIARDKYERKLEASAAVDDASDDEDGGDDPKVSGDKAKRMQRGDVLHALLLGKGKRIEVLPDSLLSGKNRSISSAAAKAARDGAIAAGRIPVKQPDMEMYERTATAVRARLADAGHVLDGTSEVAIEWWEPSAHGPVQCRTMIDHLVLYAADGLQATIPPDPPVTIKPATCEVFELKFPGDAAPDRSERTSDGLGYHVAAAARLRALNAIFPSLAGRIGYRYLFCEPHRPYAFWDPTPTGSYLEFGARVWRAAVNMWAEGTASGLWRGYHDDIMRRQIDLLRWRKMEQGFTDEE